MPRLGGGHGGARCRAANVTVETEDQLERPAGHTDRLLGAGQVIAAGRDPERLAAIPHATATALTSDPETIGRLGAEVDVVLDFLWGEPAETAMAALVAGRTDLLRPLTWSSLGEMAGA